MEGGKKRNRKGRWVREGKGWMGGEGREEEREWKVGRSRVGMEES